MDEGTQDVILQLRSTTAYVIAGTGIATVSITDNDDPQVYVKLTTSGVTEPASASVTAIAFQIVRPASGTAMTVNYAISGTATSGVDFTALPGTIAFASGDTSKTINVSALADTEIEDAETVTLTLLPGTGYTLMASQDPSATGFILDGDQPTIDVSAADTVTTLTTHGNRNNRQPPLHRRAQGVHHQRSHRELHDERHRHRRRGLHRHDRQRHHSRRPDDRVHHHRPGQ